MNSFTFKQVKKTWQLYLIVSIPLLFILVFKYIPMYGAIIAFKDFNIVKGVWGSPWVGFKHFNQFMSSINFWQLIENTLSISFYNLVIGFPIPIILALALNEVRFKLFKKTVQLVTFAPYFISTVVMVSMLYLFLTPQVGLVSRFLSFFGMENIDFFGLPELFSSLFAWSEVWHNAGYYCVIYIAALAGIDPQLYEAAKMDGASRLKKIWNVDLPGILPAVVIMLILNVGSFMKIGFEKIYLMQNPLNVSSSEIISTYVYKMGVIGANFSFGAAIGLFNSIINLVLLLIVNYLAKRVSQSSLF